MPTFISTADALAELCERVGPITQQAFSQSIYPILVEWREATPSVRRQGGWITRDGLDDLVLYMQTRRNLIDDGVWHPNRPYSYRDMDDIVSGGLYEDYQEQGD